LRTAAQQRYYLRNKARLDEESRLRKQRPEVKAARAQRDALNRNQRNSDLGWLWLGWSAMFKRQLTFDYGQLSLVNMQELENPRFKFVYRGRKTCENLCAPLPSF
jgi:hypothetical protein